MKIENAFFVSKGHEGSCDKKHQNCHSNHEDKALTLTFKGRSEKDEAPTEGICVDGEFKQRDEFFFFLLF